MDTWFLSDPALLARERSGIADLKQNEAWLVSADWSFCGGDLCVDAVLNAHAHDYPVRLTYPSLFPRIPAAVKPVDATERWSGHQYGEAGTLCLEWGPDNWQEGVTGAMLLESAHRLLEIENPLGNREDEDGRAVLEVAPSRHSFTPGQELRGEYLRFLMSRDAIEQLTLPESVTFGLFKYTLRNKPDMMLAIVHELHTETEAAIWSDPQIPEYIKDPNASDIRSGLFFRTDVSAADIIGIESSASLVDLLSEQGFSEHLSVEDGRVCVANFSSQFPALLVLDAENTPHFLLPLSSGGKPLRFASAGSEKEATSNRTPPRLESLSSKSVGIVGAGSLGSKVALSLARMGVRRFFIIDHDVLLPGNIERHALDWDSVANHKVVALKAAIERIGSGFQVIVSKLHLTGQENATLLAADLERLGACDLVIDATAEPDVFNLVAAVAKTFEKPMVWGEVYGGGIGGLVARSRPAVDPDALAMRGKYRDYYAQNSAPEHLRKKTSYGAQGPDGQIQVASDADVSVISSHLARLAADALLASETSEYPYSMYLIGLAREWVFRSPFDTVPIDMSNLESVSGSTEDAGAADRDQYRFLISLLEKNDAAGTSS